MPGSINRIGAMVASARQVAWGWFGTRGADSWRDAALAHGITVRGSVHTERVWRRTV